MSDDNNLNSNPIYINTEGATSAKSGPLRLLGVAWVSDETGGDRDIVANDDFLLHDGAGGHRIIGKRALSAGDDLYITWPGGLMVNGTYVTTLNGGVCYIYLA